VNGHRLYREREIKRPLLPSFWFFLRRPPMTSVHTNNGTSRREEEHCWYS